MVICASFIGITSYHFSGEGPPGVLFSVYSQYPFTFSFPTEEESIIEKRNDLRRFDNITWGGLIMGWVCFSSAGVDGILIKKFFPTSYILMDINKVFLMQKRAGRNLLKL